jgi:hypothetical protein
MKHTLPLITFFIWMSQIVMSQETTCAFDHVCGDTISFGESYYAKNSGTETLKIPVVIHILTKSSGFGIISEQQAASQIDLCNEIYNAHIGSRSTGIDSNIEFYLANVDEDGNDFNGILIHNIDDLDIPLDEKEEFNFAGINGTSNNQGASESLLKQQLFFDNQSYYNVLIVPEIGNNNGGSGVQGYAYFPTTSFADGIVQLYNSWGVLGQGYYDLDLDGTNDATRNLKSYTNLGGTGVHEFAHAFALFHTFQGQSCSETNCTLQGDRICDTPPTIQNSNGNSPACGGTQQVENYMDYTGQSFKTLLTEDQIIRMRLAITNSRSNLLANFSNVFEERLTDVDYVLRVPRTRCDEVVEARIRVQNTGDETLSSLKIAYGASFQDSVHYRWVGCLLPNQSKNIYLPLIETESNTIYSKVIQVNEIDVSYPIESANSRIGDDEYVFEMTPDILGGQNFYRITHPNGQFIESEPYPNFAQDETFRDTICLPQPLNGNTWCYDIELIDLVGNGVCCENGEGVFKVYKNGNLIWEVSEFEDVALFNTCDAVEVEGFYNFMGERLISEPEKGFYIIRYSNNEYKKVFK